jgi:hypothetical protein
MLISSRRLQTKFKHAADFGVSGRYSVATAQAFEAAIRTHLAAPTTQAIVGTYRGQPQMTLYVNPGTGLVVIADPNGDFVTGWRLSSAQLRHVLRSGRLGGGP